MNWWKNQYFIQFFILTMLLSSHGFSQDSFFQNLNLSGNAPSRGIDIEQRMDDNWDCENVQSKFVNFNDSYRYFESIYNAHEKALEKNENSEPPIKFISRRDGSISHVEMDLLDVCLDHVKPQLIFNKTKKNASLPPEKKFYLGLKFRNQENVVDAENDWKDCLSKVNKNDVRITRIKLTFDDNFMFEKNAPVLLPQLKDQANGATYCLEAKEPAANEKFESYQPREGKKGLVWVPGLEETLRYQTLTPACDDRLLFGEGNNLNELINGTNVKNIFDEVVRDAAMSVISDLADTDDGIEEWIGKEAEENKNIKSKDKVRNLRALTGATPKLHKMITDDFKEIMKILKNKDGLTEAQINKAQKLISDMKRKYGDIDWKKLFEKRFKDVISEEDENGEAFPTHLYHGDKDLADARDMIAEIAFIMDAIKEDEFTAQKMLKKLPREKWVKAKNEHLDEVFQVSNNLLYHEDWKEEVAEGKKFASKLDATFDHSQNKKSEAALTAASKYPEGSPRNLSNEGKGLISDYMYCMMGIATKNFFNRPLSDLNFDIPGRTDSMTQAEKLDDFNSFMIERQVARIQKMWDPGKDSEKEGNYEGAYKKLMALHESLIESRPDLYHDEDERRSCGEKGKSLGDLVVNLEEARQEEAQALAYQEQMKQYQMQQNVGMFSSMLGQSSPFSPQTQFNNFGMNAQTQNFTGFQPQAQFAPNPMMNFGMQSSGAIANAMNLYMQQQAGLQQFPNQNPFDPMYSSMMFYNQPQGYIPPNMQSLKQYITGPNYLQMFNYQNPGFPNNFFNYQNYGQPNIFNNQIPSLMNVNTTRIPAGF